MTNEQKAYIGGINEMLKAKEEFYKEFISIK
ncbi:hypothetical protein NPD7_2877 [Clostridium sporogenes]|nr:hypothetical protein NPD7_2877 [Clostridium sporogenes]